MKRRKTKAQASSARLGSAIGANSHIKLSANFSC